MCFLRASSLLGPFHWIISFSPPTPGLRIKSPVWKWFLPFYLGQKMYFPFTDEGRFWKHSASPKVTCLEASLGTQPGPLPRHCLWRRRTLSLNSMYPLGIFNFWVVNGLLDLKHWLPRTQAMKPKPGLSQWLQSFSSHRPWPRLRLSQVRLWRDAFLSVLFGMKSFPQSLELVGWKNDYFLKWVHFWFPRYYRNKKVCPV